MKGLSVYVAELCENRVFSLFVIAYSRTSAFSDCGEGWKLRVRPSVIVSQISLLNVYLFITLFFF